MTGPCRNGRGRLVSVFVCHTLAGMFRYARGLEVNLRSRVGQDLRTLRRSIFTCEEQKTWHREL